MASSVDVLPDPLLAVRELKVVTGDPAHQGIILRGLSFHVQPGEIVGIVGESGCGKSMASLAIIGLLPSGCSIADGDIDFDGERLTTASDRRLQQLRGSRVAMVFQDPLTALNPLVKVGHQVAEVLEIHQSVRRRAALAQARRLLGRVGLPDANGIANKYPHELSGGMRQRVVIAIALAGGAQLLLADEPTTALDVTVQAQILVLLRDLSKGDGRSLVLISHDMGVINEMADRVLVMYAGKIIEEGHVDDVIGAPRHPYTRLLMDAIPRVGGSKEALATAPGHVPGPFEELAGCPFAPRCPKVQTRCEVESPELEQGADSHSVACWFPYEAGRSQE